jgi:hypothetical protein
MFSGSPVSLDIVCLQVFSRFLCRPIGHGNVTKKIKKILVQHSATPAVSRSQYFLHMNLYCWLVSSPALCQMGRMPFIPLHTGDYYIFCRETENRIWRKSIPFFASKDTRSLFRSNYNFSLRIYAEKFGGRSDITFFPLEADKLGCKALAKNNTMDTFHVQHRRKIQFHKVVFSDFLLANVGIAGSDRPEADTTFVSRDTALHKFS